MEAAWFFLSGSFNQWNKGAMKKEGNKFVGSVGVRPGPYEYKFVVDGHWCIDPSKPSKDDGHGNIVNFEGAKGQPQKGQPQKGQPQQTKQPQKAQPPKGQPQKKAKKDEEEEEEEDFAAKEAKPEPVALPKTGLQLYPFKQNFANNLGKVEWLWKEDYKGWQWWHAQYKFNDELKVSFISSNRAKGLFQELEREKANKNGFGIGYTLKLEGVFGISAIFLFFGSEIPKEVTESRVETVFNWRKLDHTNDTDKAFIEEYVSQKDTIEGRETISLHKLM